MDIDLRHIRYFLAVATHLNFGRAAAELQITQPALSRQIKALEGELGVTLLVRDGRGTTLTEPGRQLVEDASQLLSAATAMQRRVRAAGKAEREFVIGFMPGIPSTEIVREFTGRHPAISVDIMSVPMAEQERYLLDGRVDVCIVRLPLQSEELGSILLFTEPMLAVVPHPSPLPTGSTRIALKDLEGLHALPLIDEPGAFPGWTGETVPRMHPFVTVEERMLAVASGRGFTILPAGLARYHHLEGTTSVVVDDLPPVAIALAFSRHRTMPEIADFADLARQYLTGP